MKARIAIASALLTFAMALVYLSNVLIRAAERCHRLATKVADRQLRGGGP